MVSVQKAVSDSKLSTPASTSTQASSKAPVKESSLLSLLIPLFVSAVTLLVVGQWAPPEFLARFTVFVLSCFVGYMVVWNVTASLHTPLMSVTNAISGIIAIGAFLQISSSHAVVQVLAGLAILVATINIVGGFTVTHRMLKMFRK
jgi:NAD(P) transhydrogenase subunit alpha